MQGDSEEECEVIECIEFDVCFIIASEYGFVSFRQILKFTPLRSAPHFDIFSLFSSPNSISLCRPHLSPLLLLPNALHLSVLSFPPLPPASPIR